MRATAEFNKPFHIALAYTHTHTHTHTHTRARARQPTNPIRRPCPAIFRSYDYVPGGLNFDVRAQSGPGRTSRIGIYVHESVGAELPVNYLHVTAASGPARTRDYSIPVGPVGLLLDCTSLLPHWLSTLSPLI